MTQPSPNISKPDYASKKCPECYSYVPRNARVCPSCKTRLGDLGRHGMAERLTNWKSYIICAVLWLAFIIYVKWAFF
jgi:hypothetical protein